MIALHVRSRLAVCLLALGGLAVFEAGCGSGGGGSSGAGSTGTVTFAVTDAPNEEILSVVVTFDALSLVGAEGEVAVPLPEPVSTDLVTLDGIATLLGKAEVPAGSYDRVRLSIVNPGRVTFADGTSQPLTVSGGQVDLRLARPIEVRAGEPLLVQLDVNLEKSLRLGDDGVILKPEVYVTSGRDAAGTTKTAGAMDACPMKGTIKSADPISGTVVLETDEGKEVVAKTSSTTVVTDEHGAATDARDLKPDDSVEIQGSLDERGRFSCRCVYRKAKEKRALRGLLRALDRGTGRCEIVTGPGKSQKVVVGGDAKIACHDESLSAADLTNGQLVTILGKAMPDGLIEARRVMIEPERFTARVDHVDASRGELACVGLPCARFQSLRLLEAGVVLVPDRSIRVRVPGAIDGPDGGAAGGLDGIQTGEEVRVLGRLAPKQPDEVDPNPCRVLARKIERKPAQMIGGVVKSVDVLAASLVLAVPAKQKMFCGKDGEERPGELLVLTTPSTRLLGGLVVDAALVGKEIKAAGTFSRGEKGWKFQAIALGTPEKHTDKCHELPKSIREKMRKAQDLICRWRSAGRDLSTACPLMTRLHGLLEERRDVEAEATLDELCALLGKSAPDAPPPTDQKALIAWKQAKVQQGVADWQAAGRDLTPVATLLQDLPALLEANRLAEAIDLLARAIQLLATK